MSLDDPNAGAPVVPLNQFPDPEFDPPPEVHEGKERAVLAGGCFWCVDAVYRQLDGAHDVVSGYTGDAADTANYRSVCSGMTDHAEAVEVTFDPTRVTFGQVLKIFFSVAHDPTQLNRQGPDVGRQYRSAIFYVSHRQKGVADAYITQLNRARVFSAPIATVVEALVAFYAAEDYHQNYAALNPQQPYVRLTAGPKVAKTLEYFPELVRPPRQE